MKRTTITFLLAAVAMMVSAAAPNGSGTYYQNANGKKGAQLKTALCSIIYNRTEKTYKYLWTAFHATDVRSDGKIWDMYSNITNYTPVTSGSTYSQEGDCYNREHSFPQSWFGSNAPMYTDLHHIYPTDGYVNGRRGDHPFGEVGNTTYTSANGFSKLGACSVSGYSGTVFEPNDEYKGDFARTYFYMVTCYEEKLHDWVTNYSSTEVTAVLDGNTYPGLQTWQLNMLLKWAKNDPVSDKEKARNNAVYGIQNNRNPFIDYPGLEQYIWGSKKDDAFSYNNYVMPEGYSSGSGGTTPTGSNTITISYSDIPDGYTQTTGTSGSLSKTVATSNDLTVRYSGINTKSSATAADHAYGYAMFLKNYGYIYNSTAPNGYYPSKVTATFSSGTGTSGKVGINFGTTSITTRNNSVTGSVSQSGTYEQTNADESKLYWNFSTTGANVQVTKIEVVYSRILSDPVTYSTPTTKTYGETFTLVNGTHFTTDGTVTLSSSNEEVAKVNGLTVTPKAAGDCIISVTYGASTNYKASNSAFIFTVTQPDGKTTAAPAEETTATLSFTTNNWGLPTSNTTGTNTYTNQGYTITLSSPSGGYKYNAGYLLLGKNNATLNFPAFDKIVTKIEVVGVDGASPNVVQNIYVGNTAVSTATTGATGTNVYAIASDYQAAGNIYTLKVTSNHNTQIKSITVYFANVKLNGYGYASYCSEYPLDFSGYETADYSAWQVTGVNGNNITFSQVTGSVKGGTGLIMKGPANETITLTSADSENVLSDNLLEGTIVPTYVAADTYYGLKGNQLVPVAASLVPAGKALLPASYLGGSEAKSYNLVFEEDPTAITEYTEKTENTEAIYNLAGQRLSKMQKGIYIVNGKKFMK